MKTDAVQQKSAHSITSSASATSDGRTARARAFDGAPPICAALVRQDCAYSSSYQLLSTPIVRRWWRNPIAVGSHALSVHGVISRLQLATRGGAISSHCTA